MTLAAELKRFEAQVKALRAERVRHERVAAELEAEYQAMRSEFPVMGKVS